MSELVQVLLAPPVTVGLGLGIFVLCCGIASGFANHGVALINIHKHYHGSEDKPNQQEVDADE